MSALSNSKHEKIAHELAFGGHHSRGAAYLAAGFGKTKEAAEVHVHKMLKKHKEISIRATELVAKVAETAVVTQASLVQELEEARELAIALEMPSAAVQAIMGKAKITGNIIDRAEIDIYGDLNRMTDGELMSEVRRRAKDLAIDLEPVLLEDHSDTTSEE